MSKFKVGDKVKVSEIKYHNGNIPSNMIRHGGYPKETRNAVVELVAQYGDNWAVKWVDVNGKTIQQGFKEKYMVSMEKKSMEKKSSGIIPRRLIIL